MGHAIRALVARFEQLSAAASALCVVAPLAQGYGLVVAPDADDEQGLLEQAGERVGRSVPVAFVATDYFGGAGTQHARVWRPSDAATWSNNDSGAINAALALIGVTRSPDADEFDSVGLGWYRSNDDWAAFARHGKAVWQKAAVEAASQAWKARRRAQS